MKTKWPTLSERVSGEPIVDLSVDGNSGYVVIQLQRAYLWVSADSDGYHLFVDEEPAGRAISRDAVEDLED